MEVVPKQISFFQLEDGRIPFSEWVDSIEDKRAVKIIRARLQRLKSGLLGDYKSVGPGVLEARIHYGPGYRIYFGQIGNTVILLLCGGEKNSQLQDIARALDYWMNFRRRYI